MKINRFNEFKDKYYKHEKIKNYNEFLILEKYEDNIRAKLIEMGVTNKNELENNKSSKKVT
jgi:hypothetical protein